MKRNFVIGSFIITALFIPVFTSADTITDLQAYIQKLTAQIAALKAQQTSSTTPPSAGATDDYPSTSSPTTCPTLTVTMQRGSRDATTGGQVSELQIFLANHFNLNEDDVVTGYFGPTTHRYVVKFQTANNLPAYGIVGSMTRAAIAKVCQTPTACTFNGQTVAHESSVIAYQSSTVQHATTCISQSRTCSNGVLSGSYIYASCTVASELTPTCALDSSSPQTRIQSCPTGQTGSITQQRTSSCATGATAPTWSAWATTTSTCVAVTLPTAQSCSFNGQTIAYGASITAYQSPNVPYGSTCTSEQRTCTAGTLSGSFANSSCTIANAPTTPTLTINSIGTITNVSVNRNGMTAPEAPLTEVPIWIIGGGWRAYLFPTGWTYLCASPDSLLSGSVSVQSQYCGRIAQDQLHDLSRPWIYNYNGINSAYVKDEYGSNPVLYGAVHGENKNEVVNGLRVQNTVDTDFSKNANFNVANCASGYTNGVYDDCWEAYNAFISLATIPYNTTTTWGRTTWANLGPMIWPAAGYTKPDGSKAAHGVRVPVFFPSDDGYLYVYYLDDSIAGGGLFGIKVARALIADLPTKGQHAFYSYVNGAFTQPALPDGFSNSSITSFYSVKGPQTLSLFDSSVTTPIRFSVASIAGTSKYIGALEYMDSNKAVHVALTVSNDLVHWSNPTTILQTQNWGSGKLDFPLFVDSTGWTNTRIDPNDFYLEGTDTSGNVHLLHVSVRVQ